MLFKQQMDTTVTSTDSDASIELHSVLILSLSSINLVVMVSGRNAVCIEYRTQRFSHLVGLENTGPDRVMANCSGMGTAED